MKRKAVYRFKVELLEIEPLIWRTIEVPSTYSFWDLHVAIQDAMGWLDYHLHQFSLVPKSKRKPVQIGVPDKEFAEKVLAGWTIPIAAYFVEPGDGAKYEYDFGDGWLHQVVSEGILLPDQGAKYPRCIGGERACPPEDCGGVHGYHDLLKILRNPKHEEYEEMVYWLKNHANNYHPYNPDSFNQDEVVFWDPKKRFKMAFEEA